MADTGQERGNAVANVADSSSDHHLEGNFCEFVEIFGSGSGRTW
jgi:hypothetical protein